VVVSLIVHGPPRGKGRPRFTRTGRVFTDAKTAEYEGRVKRAGIDAMAGREPLLEPCWVKVTAYLPVAKSLPKKERARRFSGERRPCQLPDLDNIAKAVLDGLNGVVFLDDRQVCAIASQKFYGEPPRVEVSVGCCGGEKNDRSE